MRAGFLRRCQNSPRQTSPEMVHIQAWKKCFTNIMITIWISVFWKILTLLVKKWPAWSWNGHVWLLNFQFYFFQNCKKMEAKKYVIFVIAFDPIKIWINWALQNDCQNLSFVKDNKVLGQKMTTDVRKLANSWIVIFISKHSLRCFI